MFHAVHFIHDSQNSFSVNHDLPKPEIVDRGVTKISLPPLPLVSMWYSKNVSGFTVPGWW